MLARRCDADPLGVARSRRLDARPRHPVNTAEALLDLLAEAPGHVLDATALGDHSLVAGDALLAGASDLEIYEAIDAWYAAEAAGWAVAQVMVFAAAVDAYPRAQVIAVRPAEGSPSGALIVTVRCPHAGAHASHARGDGLHHHGIPSFDRPDSDGSLGLRHPHCGELSGGITHADLPRYEIIVPPSLRGLFA